MVKTDLLEQLATIASEVDRLGIATVSPPSLEFDVSKKDYDELFAYFQNRHNRISDKPRKTFTITFGGAVITFNRNNV